MHLFFPNLLVPDFFFHCHYTVFYISQLFQIFTKLLILIIDFFLLLSKRILLFLPGRDMNLSHAMVPFQDATGCIVKIKFFLMIRTKSLPFAFPMDAIHFINDRLDTLYIFTKQDHFFQPLFTGGKSVHSFQQGTCFQRKFLYTFFQLCDGMQVILLQKVISCHKLFQVLRFRFIAPSALVLIPVVLPDKLYQIRFRLLCFFHFLLDGRNPIKQEMDFLFEAG